MFPPWAPPKRLTGYWGVEMDRPVGIICRNVVSMRCRPDALSESVSQALWGERVALMADSRGFALIETPDGYRGWVIADAVCPALSLTGRSSTRLRDTGAEPAAHASGLWGTDEQERVIGELLAPLRTQPRSDARPITLLTIGARVTMAAGSDDDGYAPIALPGGGIGFVETSVIREPPSARIASREELAHEAFRFMGIPYLWGGRSTFGMDCSGFVQMVYGLHGTILPRDAYLQAAWTGAEPVERDGLSPGDLVFFGGDDPRGRGITHVGMALDPPDFIHAAGGTGVTISSLEDLHYSAIYRCAVRPRLTA